jgi:hypothetical protein
MKMRRWLTTLLPILALIALTAAISAPVNFQRILNPTTDDYDAHIVWTLKILKHQLPPTGIIALPMYELIVGFIYWRGRGLIGLYETAALVQVLAQIAAALMLYFWIGPIQRRWGEVQRVFWAISLTLVAPVMLLWFIDRQFYFGYIGLASYHNPTIHLLRPFALVQFFLAVRIFQTEDNQNQPRNSVRIVLLSAGATAASMLTKPNFDLALLPALAVISFWFGFKRRPMDWRLLIFGQVVPFAVIFIYQLVLLYFLPDPEESGIILTFFGSELVWSNYLPLKLILSLLFPFSVLFFIRRQIFKDTELLLSLVAFGVSLLHMYFFAESGDRFTHGNFRWGAQTTLFILFAVLVRRLITLAREAKPARPRLWPAYALYLLHLAAGIAYYVYAYVQPNYN